MPEHVSCSRQIQINISPVEHMRVLAATESGAEGRQATVTMPLSQQIHKAHTGNQARSQPGGEGVREGSCCCRRQTGNATSICPLSLSLSLSLALSISLSIAIPFCRLASFDCVKQDLCYSCHFLTLTLPIYVPGPAQAPSNQDTVR